MAMARHVNSLLLLISLPLAAEPGLHLTPILEDASHWISHNDADDSADQDLWLNEFLPGLSLHGQTAYHRLDIDYQAQYLSYLSGANAQQSDSLNHILNAQTASELLRNHLFLDTQAQMGQVLSTPDGRRSVDQLSAPNDYSQYKSYQLRPRWQQRLGTGQLDLAYSYGQTHVGNMSSNPIASQFQDSSVYQQLNSKIQSDPKARLYGYISYDETQDEPANRLLDDSGEKKSQAYGHYRWSRQWLTLLRGGHEEYYGPNTNRPDTNGDYLSAGVTWQPNRRVTATAIKGNRETEASLSLQPNERNRLLASYTERELGLGDQDGWSLVLDHQGRNGWLKLQRRRSVVTQSRLLIGDLPVVGSFSPKPYLTYWDAGNQQSIIVSSPNAADLAMANGQLYYEGNLVEELGHDRLYVFQQDGQTYFLPQSEANLSYGANRYLSTENSLLTGYERGRSKWQLSYRDVERELIDMQQIPGRIRSFDFSYRLRLTARDAVIFDQLTEYNEEPQFQRKGFYFEHKLSFEHALSRDILARLSYSYHDFDSNKALQDYHENRITAAIRAEF